MALLFTDAGGEKGGDVIRQGQGQDHMQPSDVQSRAHSFVRPSEHPLMPGTLLPVFPTFPGPSAPATCFFFSLILQLRKL